MEKLPYFPASSGTFFRKTQSYMSAAFKYLELSFVEGIVLVQVCDNPGTTQDAIAYHLSLDSATVARALKRLEHSQLILREIDIENQRTKKSYPTDEGIRKKTAIGQIMDYWGSLLLDGLTPEENENIFYSLSILRDRALAINVASATKECLSILNQP